MNYTLTTTSTEIVGNYLTVIERTGAQNAMKSGVISGARILIVNADLRGSGTFTFK